jgi:O-succinylhomoserine sulfhydrylase
MSNLEFETLAIRAGIHRSQFNEHSEALFLTSSFVFENAAQAAARFAGDESGMVYTRYTNPTVEAMQERLAALEGAQCCVATASGMSAILATVLGLLRSGDHIVASQSLFGATVQLFNNWLPRFGIQVSFVGSPQPAAWAQALRPNTRMLFLETPSNPLTEIYDIAALSDVAHRANAWLAVDNCFCTPALQRPFELGADIVIHSATKYLDGQGRVLGGAVLGARGLIQDPLTTFLRNAGPTLSPFNAWVILKGLETLKLRMDAHCAGALTLARWLEQHASLLSRAIQSSPARAGLPSADQRGRRSFLRREGWTRSGLASGRWNEHDLHYRQPRRCEDHDHSSGQHHAWPHVSRSKSCRWNRRRIAARRRRIGIRARHTGRPRTGTSVVNQGAGKSPPAIAPVC